MKEPTPMKFTDVVKKIARNQDAPGYTVIFRRHAAFYALPEEKDDAAGLLARSAQDRKPVLVRHDAASVIFEVEEA